MAYWAELKRRNWYCINGCYLISWYRGVLYDEWWNSRTDEQRERIERYREQKRQKEQEELEQAFMNLGLMTSFIVNSYRNSPACWGIADKLHKSYKTINSLNSEEENKYEN